MNKNSVFFSPSNKFEVILLNYSSWYSSTAKLAYFYNTECFQ